MFRKKVKYFINRHIVILGMLCLFIGIVIAQENKPKGLRDDILKDQKKLEQKNGVQDNKKTKKQEPDKEQIHTNPSDSQAKYVRLEHSDTWSFDNQFNPDAQILRGNVQFIHENALMFCDSAYFYEGKNSLDAFGNVRIIQGDTLFVYGDFLFYDGKKKLAKLRRNVRMENRSAILTTDSLNYDRAANLAYYFSGGKIKDDINVLTSVWGQYSPASKVAFFKKNVHLVNPDYTMDSDTLKYNTNTNIADIVGQTHIKHKDETDIYSRLGWYNTSNEQSMLLKRSLIVHKDGKTMIGDTIFYDKQSKFGEAFSNVELNDTVQKTTLKGDYVYYNELTEKGLATDSALLIDWSSKDTMYVHADTILTAKDSIYDTAFAYKNTRIFRNDIQGICDSLIYSSRDSIIHMHGNPVLWSDQNQLSGDLIKAFTKNQQIDRAEIEGSAIAVQMADSLSGFFNQLSGKQIIAYVDSGALKKIDVNGNAETIFFPRDDSDSTLIGLNRTQSSFVFMYLKEKKVDKILFTTVSNGTMSPLEGLTSDKMYLKNYFWVEDQRPKDKEDVFTHYSPFVRVNPGNPKSEKKEKADSKK